MTEIIILFSLIGIAVGRYPGLRMNRATIAFFAAVMLILSPALTLEEAFLSLDLSTLALLFAMMVVNSSLKFSGFFAKAGAIILKYARTPSLLLALIILFSGLFSALFLNDTVALMFTPLVLEVVLLAGRNPVPYLLGLAVSANVGSMATIIGNPQNILIGNSSGIPFIRFTGYLVIPAIFGLFICWLVIFLLFRREFALPLKIPGTLHLRPIYKPLFIKSLVSVALMLVLILAGVQVTLAALSASALLLFTRRIKPQRVFREIDISLLVFFSGLFIITSAVWKLGFYNTLIERLFPYLQNNLPLFGIFSAFLSNLISNVPAVMLLSPLITRFPSQELAWIFLAMSSTLAGNLTLLGSVANLIVAESAESRGYRLSFLTYLKVGFPVTILTITVSTLFLILI